MKKTNRIIVIAFAAVVGILFWLQAKEDVLVGDEIVYTYVLDTSKYGNYWGPIVEPPHIATIQDVVSSQVDHYLNGHGRVLVNGVEQFFSGVSTPQVFYIVNSIVFVLTLLLLVMISQGGRMVWSPFAWLSATLAMYYLFPSLPTLWNSINLGVNYLWPSMLILAYLLTLRYVRGHNPVKKWWYPILVVFGVIAGWSHEAFCIPLSGALFIYYLFHLRQLRGVQLLFVASFWLGSLILFLAPGNFVRLNGGGTDGVFFLRMSNALNLLLQIKLLWLMTVLLIIGFICRRKLTKEYVLGNKFLFMLLGLAVTFIFFANTQAHSCTFVELVSAIIILGFLRPALIWADGLKPLKWVWCVCVAVFIIHQAAIIRDEWQVNRQVRKAINDYVESADGIAILDLPKVGSLVKPWIKSWSEVTIGGGGTLSKRSIERFYSHNAKRLNFLMPDEYMALTNPSAYFCKKNLIPGDAGFYTTPGSSAFWIKADSLRTHDLKLVYSPVSFKDDVPPIMKLKRWLTPSAYPVEEAVDSLRLLQSRYGDYYYIPKPGTRRVVEIITNNK